MEDIKEPTGLRRLLYDYFTNKSARLYAGQDSEFVFWEPPTGNRVAEFYDFLACYMAAPREITKAFLHDVTDRVSSAYHKFRNRNSQ